MNRRTFLAAVPAAAAAAPATGVARHGLSRMAPRPPLGWNSFNSYGVYLHEEAARANIDAMAKKLKPSGYEYFVIDNGWFGEYKLVPGTRYPAEKHASDVRLNEYGLLQPSKTYFPGGLRPLIERAHNAGLKFGLHLMRGIPRKAVAANLPIQGTRYTARDAANPNSICTWCHYNYGVNMAHPAGQAFYNSLIKQLAGWGVDFIKADDLVPYPAEILGLANAIEQCGREMTFSLSPGSKASRTDLPYFRRANMLRVTADIWDRRSDLDKAFEAWKKWQGTETPGFWIDLDMIPFGQLLLMSLKQPSGGESGAALAGYGFNRQCGLTRPQMYTFITQRALAASPLMMGGDLPSLDDFSLGLITNREMLACNQNGVMGALVWEQDGIEVWHTSRMNAYGEGWIGIFNRTGSERTVQCGRREMGLEPFPRVSLEEIWTGEKTVLEKAKREWRIAADGVAFLKFGAESLPPLEGVKTR